MEPSTPFMIALGTFFLGLVLGLWMDSLFRRVFRITDRCEQQIQRDAVLAALTELVELKDMKDWVDREDVRKRIISGEGLTREELRVMDVYRERKGRAWVEARQALGPFRARWQPREPDSMRKETA